MNVSVHQKEIINLCLYFVISEDLVKDKPVIQQFDLFTDYKEVEEKREKEKEEEMKDKKL